MVMVSEDDQFSFPAISTNSSQLADITSLWRISSQVKANLEEFDGHGRRKIFRRSLCDIEDYCSEAKKREVWTEEYDSMDMLWENFNDVEECWESKSSLESFCGADCESVEGIALENAAKDLKVFKTNSGLLSAKKQKLGLVLKVMKQLLLLRKMASIRKRQDF